MLGAAVNRLAADQPAGVGIGLGFAGFAVGWALIRFLSSIAPQVSDVVFAPVRQAAQRTTATETFAHALNLSLDFHQTKRSGSLSRTVDRGSRAVDFLLRILAFNLIPTGLELILAAGVLAGAYDWRFGAIAVVVVVDLRRRRPSPSPTGGSSIGATMNTADTEAAGLVGRCPAELRDRQVLRGRARAAAGYDQALGVYNAAALKANTSLALLNVIQVADHERRPGRHGRAWPGSRRRRDGWGRATSRRPS